MACGVDGAVDGGDLEGALPAGGRAGQATVRDGVRASGRSGHPGRVPVYRGWRLVAIDGTTFDLPDTVANVEAFLDWVPPIEAAAKDATVSEIAELTTCSACPPDRGTA